MTRDLWKMALDRAFEIDLGGTSLIEVILSSQDRDRERFLDDLYADVAPGGRADRDEQTLQLEYGILSILVDQKLSRPYWRRLAMVAPSIDKDEAVFALWRHLRGKLEGDNQLQRLVGPIEEHDRILCQWFLRRYDLTHARRIYRDSWLIGRIELVLLALLLIIVLGGTYGLTGSGMRVGWQFSLLPSLAYLFVAWALYHGMKGSLFPTVQGLVPRLAGACAVGGLGFLTAQGFRFFLLDSGIKAAFASAALAALYLLIEVERKMYPHPRLGVLVGRAGSALAIGVCHAVAISIMMLPILQALIGPEHGGLPSRPLAVQLANAAGFILLVGIILNIMWAEEPLTEPL